MNKILNRRNTASNILLLLLLLSIGLNGGETQWIAIGDLHNWYHSAGCEIEVGRRHLIPDQQDGLIWPGQFRYQDSQAAKAIWIGTTNYDDPVAGKTFAHKVVHFGPRVENEEIEFISQKFMMVSKYDKPIVTVDGTPAGQLDFLEEIDSVDVNLPSDRMIYNVVNTGIGLTMTRKIYAWSNQYHDDYFIYEYEFENTGIYDLAGNKHNKTLDGVQIFFQYRYAVAKEGCAYGYNWLPQSATWGHNTVNEVIYNHPDDGSPFRAQYSWHGKHSKWLGPADNIGGPNYLGDGRLGTSQYVGFITLHADTSPNDQTDDVGQPSTTKEVGSDDPWTYNNDSFNGTAMSQEYAVMTAGRPAESHATRVGDTNADEYGGTPGGWSQGQGFGPYTIAPGEKIRIVMAEGANGINRQLRYEVGYNWLFGSGDFVKPDGSTTSDPVEYKNSWVETGEDSILQTFERAQEVFENGFMVPDPPPHPATFSVTGGGDRVILEWSDNAESHPGFDGYRVYRAIEVPDTTYEMIFECGGNSGNPIVNLFYDISAKRGFDYYYYVTAFDDGSNMTLDGQPKVLESSKFFTMTNSPTSLKRPPGKKLSDIRVVPNPYNIRTRQLQFGTGDGADRLMFYNIPPFCKISIYTERGDKVETIIHDDGSGDEEWKSLTSSRQVVVSGLYIAYIEVTEDAYDSDTGELLFKKGDSKYVKFVIIR